MAIQITSLSGSGTTTPIIAKANNMTGTIGTTDTKLVAPTVEIDTNSAYSTSTGNFTVPVAGTYRLSGMVTWGGSSASSAGSIIYMTGNKNSTNISRMNYFVFQVTTVSFTGGFAGTTIIPNCVVGDVLNIVVSRDSSVSSTTLGGGGVANWVAYEKID